MTEIETAEKISDLLSSLDTVKKYSSVRGKFLPLLFLVLSTLFVIALTQLLINYYDYLTATPYLGSIPTPGSIGYEGEFYSIWVPIIAIISLSSVIASLIIRNAIKSVSKPYFEEARKEGVLGLIGILDNIDFQAILRDVSGAKMGYLLLSVLKTILYWVIVFIAVFIVFTYLSLLAILIVPIWATIAGSLALVLILRRRRYAADFRKIWYFDSLLWELRWLYTEFKGSEFQA